MMLNSNLKLAVFSVISTLSLASCQSFGPATTQIKRDGIDIISTNSDQKLSYIKTRGNNEIFCAPREGDIADTYSSGASLGLSVTGKSESVSDSSGKGAISLGGRNPEVLLARELLFRACELASNTNADGPQAVQIYSLFLDKMIEMSQSISGTGTSPQSSSPQPISNQIITPIMKPNDQNQSKDKDQNKQSSNNTDNNSSKDCDPTIDFNCPIKP